MDHNDELVELYESCMKWKSQYNTDITHARAEGKAEGKLEDAKEMLKDNIPIEKVSIQASRLMKLNE